MDALTLTFSALISAISSPMVNQVKGLVGSELQSVSVMHEGYEVSYQYQNWIIRTKSVCAENKHNLATYSRCTVAAKSLFHDLCKELTEQKGNNRDWRYRKPKDMYCKAAVSFKPTVAQLSSGKSQNSSEKLKIRCNQLIIDAMGNDDPQLARKRDQACRVYERSKR